MSTTSIASGATTLSDCTPEQMAAQDDFAHQWSKGEQRTAPPPPMRKAHNYTQSKMMGLTN